MATNTAEKSVKTKGPVRADSYCRYREFAQNGLPHFGAEFVVGEDFTHDMQVVKDKLHLLANQRMFVTFFDQITPGGVCAAGALVYGRFDIQPMLFCTASRLGRANDGFDLSRNLLDYLGADPTQLDALMASLQVSAKRQRRQDHFGRYLLTVALLPPKK